MSPLEQLLQIAESCTDAEGIRQLQQEARMEGVLVLVAQALRKHGGGSLEGLLQVLLSTDVEVSLPRATD